MLPDAVNLSDHGSATDLLYLPTLIQLGYQLDNLCNLGRILVGFNGTQTTSLGEVVLLVAARSIIALVPFIVINEPSSFNAILGRMWIHAMNSLPSSYHQMLSFLTSLGHVDIPGDQKSTRACYAVESPQKDQPSK